MPLAPVFHPATRYSLKQLAAFFTAAYEGYAFPVLLTDEFLARRMREETLDLSLSGVMELAGDPCGMFLLGRRENSAWCGGFGVNKPRRGLGLSAMLCSEMLARCRHAGVGRLQLEVLVKNAAAIAAYRKGGFAVNRDLLVMNRMRPSSMAQESTDEIRPVDPREVLRTLFEIQDPVPCWQREVAGLMVRHDLKACASKDDDARILFTVLPDASARLLGLCGESPEAMKKLLLALGKDFGLMRIVNEPAESRWLEALLGAGFVETDRQHEMTIGL